MKRLYTGILLFFCISLGAQTKIVDEKINTRSLIKKGLKWLYADKDSAYFYFNRAYQISRARHNWLACVDALQKVTYVDGWYFDLEKYRRTMQTIDSVLKRQQVYFDTIRGGRDVKNYHLIDKTNYYTKLKNYKKARQYAVKLQRNIEPIPDSIRTRNDNLYLGIAYEYEAGSYKNEGKYKIAEGIYEKGLRLILSKQGEEDALPTYKLMGSLYREQRQYEKSNRYLKKGLDGEIEKGAPSKNKIVKSCYVIVRNHIDLKNADSAMHYLRIAHQQLAEDDPLLYQYYHRLSEINKATGKYEEALAAIDKALDLMTNSRLKRIERIEFYRTKARIYEDMGHYEQALKQYQYAFKALSKDFSPENLAENPSPESVDNNIEYLKTLKDKAAALYKARNFDAALQTAVTAVTVLDSLKPEFQNENDKQLLIENSYSVFESGLAAVLKEERRTDDPDLIDRAFFFMEKSKSAVLLEAFLSAKAYNFAGIPGSFLEKELQLKANMNYFQKKVDKDDENDEWKERLFEARKQHRERIRELESNYPEYYNLKYNSQVTDTETLRQTIDKNTLSVSYFYGKEALYTIAISKAAKEYIKIPLDDDLETQIRDLHNMLINPASEPGALVATAGALYQRILHPLLKDKPYTRLIVMPDGILNYIPFEILHDGTQYITERMAVSYAPSATLLQQLQEKKAGNTRVMAFAPDFSLLQEGEKPRILQPIPGAKEEARDVLSYFKGRIYEGADASLKNFNAESASYGMHHLATHAVVNDKMPEYSYLAFTPSKNEEYLLYLNDIYAMKVNAAMVSLSACESGIGDLKRGEGMISLARAFFYAGAASIANTKWKISDYSTSQIMERFYNYLSKGKEKDEALRLAKKDFVTKNRNTALSHPYHWAGVVVTGNTVAVKTSLSLWTWLLPLFVIAALTIWFLQRRRKES